VTETNFNKVQVSSNLLTLLIAPFSKYEFTLDLMIERSTLNLNMILKMIRSRIGFFGLFTLMENYQLTQIQVKTLEL